MDTKRNILREKSFDFAVRIVNLHKFLTEEKKELVLSKQILRSGTNPGAMVREAANAESGSDFIHKLSIAQKEIDETMYWLELMKATNYLTESQFESLNSDAVEIIKLIKSSIITRRKNLNNAK
ncbi:MAG: four helix bundle protein [Arcicella sp.]|jgi:four helix bundle protein|nr:four helix bundle protein [Arcicella sp.]